MRLKNVQRVISHPGKTNWGRRKKRIAGDPHLCQCEGFQSLRAQPQKHFKHVVVALIQKIAGIVKIVQEHVPAILGCVRRSGIATVID